jgi:hypothetical protein
MNETRGNIRIVLLPYIKYSIPKVMKQNIFRHRIISYNDLVQPVILYPITIMQR